LESSQSEIEGLYINWNL